MNSKLLLYGLTLRALFNSILPVACLYLGMYFQTALGDYDVSVKLLEYNRDQDNDFDARWGIERECDVYFKICLQPLSPRQG